MKRAIDRLAPRCLDAATHTCWSSPPGEESTSEADLEFTKDIFRDALDYRPDQPDATFRLAETLDRLGKNDEAQTMFQAYLRTQPNGTYAEKARIALQRIEKKSGRKD
jgi:thioredoxin-like negative regulator of GroEL